MSSDTPIRSLIEALNNRHWLALRELLTPGVLFHLDGPFLDSPFGGIRSREHVVRYLQTRVDDVAPELLELRAQELHRGHWKIRYKLVTRQDTRGVQEVGYIILDLHGRAISIRMRF